MSKMVARMIKLKLYDDKELIIDDITHLEPKGHELKIYRNEKIVATVDKDQVKNWYIKSGYNQRSD